MAKLTNALSSKDNGEILVDLNSTRPTKFMKIPKEILKLINPPGYEIFDEYGPLHPSDFGPEENKEMKKLLIQGLEKLKELKISGYENR